MQLKLAIIVLLMLVLLRWVVDVGAEAEVVGWLIGVSPTNRCGYQDSQRVFGRTPTIITCSVHSQSYQAL